MLGAFVVGLRAGRLAGQAAYPPAAVRASATPQGAVTDSALVALGTVLVFIPGLVTTAAGLLLLLPPTRAAARPLADRDGRPPRSPLITVAATGCGPQGTRTR